MFILVPHCKSLKNFCFVFEFVLLNSTWVERWKNRKGMKNVWTSAIQKKIFWLGFSVWERSFSWGKGENKNNHQFPFYNAVCFFVCSVFCLKRLSSLARHYLPSTIYYQQVREKRERARERRGEWSGLKFQAEWAE